MRQTVAFAAVADLIVVLGADDKMLALQAHRRITVAPFSVLRILPGEHKSLPKRSSQIFDARKILVVAFVLAGQQNVQSMMEIIIPDGGKAPAPKFGGANHVRVVAITFRHEMYEPLGPFRKCPNRGGQLFDEWPSRNIKNRVDGVEPQCVDMKFVKPLQRIINEMAADRIALRTFEVQSVSPCSFIVAGEVRREIRGVIAFWSKVVVDNIEHNSGVGLVARVHEALERFTTSIGILHGEGIDAVVAPVSVARKLRDGHQFNRRDAKIPERLKAGNDRVECALGCEGADMKFINHILRKRYAAPGLIFPIEARTDDLRWTVHTVRLRFGRRIRQIFVSIEPIFIFCAWCNILDLCVKVTKGKRCHLDSALAWLPDTNFDVLGARRPNQKTALTRVEDRCAQGSRITILYHEA